MGGLFTTPKADNSAIEAQRAELARQNELVERQRAETAAERARLDAQEEARNRALAGTLRGRIALLGGDEEGVDSAEARGTETLKRRLGA
ncbi:hypothetical protein [Roseococcus thiosulfatophilus]|uniref:hypothetical protein n=1 Tax=Roseococcus thiosulfatophilus TaxID=35813 RepID=UPI001A905FDB|nr:hypothetical protein [Roseococcus thiosulfatophilus]